MFPSPAGAIGAAARAQRELAARPWADGVDVRVRIGLHTGEGVLGGDSCLGLDVNRAARTAAAAHGGQVLLSEATRGLVERCLPPSTRLRNLGRHCLKDLPEPERLHQLVIEGLEQEFRRRGRSTPGRTTCRPSSPASSAEATSSPGSASLWPAIASSPFPAGWNG